MAASRRPQPPVQDAMAPWVVEVSSRPTSRPASHDRAATIATVVLSVPLTGPVQRLPQQYLAGRVGILQPAPPSEESLERSRHNTSNSLRSLDSSSHKLRTAKVGAPSSRLQPHVTALMLNETATLPRSSTRAWPVSPIAPAAPSVFSVLSGEELLSTDVLPTRSTAMEPFCKMSASMGARMRGQAHPSLSLPSFTDTDGGSAPTPAQKPLIRLPSPSRSTRQRLSPGAPTFKSQSTAVLASANARKMHSHHLRDLSEPVSTPSDEALLLIPIRKVEVGPRALRI